MKKILILSCLLILSFAAFSQVPDRSQPPELGPAKNLRLPPIQRFTLSNGLPVVLMERHDVPILQVNLLVHTGAFDDPAGKEGLSSFVMNLLDEGAGTYNSLELADEIEFLGARISTYSSDLYSTVSATVPVARMNPVLSLMSDIVLQPAFSEKEIERIRKLSLNDFLQDYDDPSTIAVRAFDTYLLGTSSPYAKFAHTASIQSYSREDLLQFHQSQFVTGNSTLIVVGDTKKEAIIPVLEKHFSAYPQGTPEKAARPVPKQVKGRKVYIVDKPGAAQSVIRIGRIGIAQTDADYHAVLVMNTILGGSFTSRLNSNLREEHGYSYGARSRFSTWPVPGPFVAYASVHTEVTAAALSEFFKEFEKMRQPMPEDDYLRGKNYVALGYANNFQTNGGIAFYLGDMVINQLPENYFNTYVEKTLSVTHKQVEDAAKKHIVPDNMVVVIVGDRKKIEEGVKNLKLGKVSFLSIEDVLGEALAE